MKKWQKVSTWKKWLHDKSDYICWCTHYIFFQNSLNFHVVTLRNVVTLKWTHFLPTYKNIMAALFTSELFWINPVKRQMMKLQRLFARTWLHCESVKWLGLQKDKFLDYWVGIGLQSRRLWVWVLSRNALSFGVSEKWTDARRSNCNHSCLNLFTT